MQQLLVSSLCFLSVLLLACNKSTERSSLATEQQSWQLNNEGEVGKDELRKRETNYQYAGHDYKVFLEVVPTDTLPRVLDHENKPYLDNLVRIYIYKDGQFYLQNEVHKALFADFLTAEQQARMILGGMVFLKVQNEAFVFALQFNMPMVEEGGVPLLWHLPIDGKGKTTVERDTIQDLDYRE